MHTNKKNHVSQQKHPEKKLPEQARGTCMQIYKWREDIPKHTHTHTHTHTHRCEHRHTHTHTHTHTHAHTHTHTHTHTGDWRIAMLAGTAMRDGWLYLQCYMPLRARGCVNAGSSSGFTRQWYRKDGCHTGKKITHLPGLWKPNRKQIQQDRKSLGWGKNNI